MYRPFPPLLCALRENKTVRGMGPKADNIYTVGTESLHKDTIKCLVIDDLVLDHFF